MRRTFIILALSGLCACYFKTPTHSSEGDDEEGGLDASAEDAAESDAEANASDAAEQEAGEAPCTCSAPAPFCVPDGGGCVECRDNADCRSGSYCLTDTGQCVGCLNANHCASQPAASVCDMETHRCSPCRPGMDADCSNVAGAKLCNAGTCVQCIGDRRDACGEDKAVCNAQFMCAGCSADGDCQRFGKVCDEASGRCVACTIDSEKAQCGTKSCNPASKQCTDTDRESVSVCNKCVADSECKADHRCIELSYGGASRGGYCMQRAGSCAPPFQAPAIRRASLSGAAAEDYCGIAESRTSCEAIMALQAAQACSEPTQCDAPGALCATINAGKACTYACETSFECPSGILCNGTAPDRYCGK
jgi:hypothetical protein